MAVDAIIYIEHGVAAELHGPSHWWQLGKKKSSRGATPSIWLDVVCILLVDVYHMIGQWIKDKSFKCSITVMIKVTLTDNVIMDFVLNMFETYFILFF